MRQRSPRTLRNLPPAKLEREIKKGLAVLLKAHDYAQRTRSKGWDFAVEIDQLEAIGLSSNDLRWLVAAGFVAHATEVRPIGKNKRSFRFTAGLLFGRKTCFVLTESGARLGRVLVSKSNRRQQESPQRKAGRPVAAPNYAPVNSRRIKPTPQGIESLVLLLKCSAQAGNSERKGPGVRVKKLKTIGVAESDLHWLASQGLVEMGQDDRGRNTQTRRLSTPPPGQPFSGKTCLILNEAGTRFARGYLVPHYHWEERRFTVGGLLVKEFKEPAPAQETILRAFQELKWAPSMDDPLPRIPGIDPKVRLHDTVKNLKRHQQRRLIDFSVEGNGTKVRWKLSL